MTQVAIDARKASKRDCVRFIAAQSEEINALRRQIGQANIFITNRLRTWPYNWANWIRPFFPKRPPVKPAVKVGPKEDANV